MTELDETPEQEKPSRKKRGGLFVTDAELIERLNVPEKIARQAIEMLDRDRSSGFPQKQKLWGNRRYWPAVRTYLDYAYAPKLDASPQRRQSNTR
jgi:hypothetical protein